MLELYNSYGKKREAFRPVKRDLVTIFTCGPSVYQRSHIGNFRTFLFEDTLVRYLLYSGYHVRRGMNFTDIEDKAIEEASRRGTSVKRLTDRNIREFVGEMELLRMRTPDYLPRASESVKEAVAIIARLLALGIAYRHKANVYFDPLKVRGFGRLYGLDMKRWPKGRRRFHKDTYPGTRWNRGDFIVWHGCTQGDRDCWDTALGRGRPSWNVQDPAMVSKYFHEPLTAYCGGTDNLFRHHDYSMAILEAVRPFQMARFWLHCEHLHVNGRKMSKSRGNIYYTDTVMKKGYGADELRFFLIYGHYREVLDYSDAAMEASARKLRELKRIVARIRARAGQKGTGGEKADKIRNLFASAMDDDLNVKSAFDAVYEALAEGDIGGLKKSEASGLLRVLRNIDGVLQVIF